MKCCRHSHRVFGRGIRREQSKAVEADRSLAGGIDSRLAGGIGSHLVVRILDRIEDRHNVTRCRTGLDENHRIDLADGRRIGCYAVEGRRSAGHRHTGLKELQSHSPAVADHRRSSLELHRRDCCSCCMTCF